MTAANAGEALATVLVDELVRHGLTDACLAPGSRSAPLAIALHADPRVRLHVRLDERSASFFALGLAKASQRPVAVACTSGTAAANFLPAVVEADASRVPLLVLTADRPPELRGTGANQTVDQVKLYGDAVRWYTEVAVPEDAPGVVVYWRSLASRMVAEARGSLGGAAGPVHCNLGFREPLLTSGSAPPAVAGRRGAAQGFREPLDGRPAGAPWTTVNARGTPPAAGDVRWLTERLQSTQRGLLAVGDTRSDPRPLLALAEAAAWPVLAEPQSGARAGSHTIAAYDLLLRDDRFAAEHRADLVVVVGRLGLSKTLLARLDASVPQVLLDDGGGWLDPQRSLSRIVAADPGMLAAAVTGALTPRPASAWLASWQAADRAAREAVDAALDAEPVPSEPRVARDLTALAPDGAVLTVASSMPARDVNTFMAPRDGLRMLANRGASGIDGFCSTALGVAAAHDGPAFALAGDLSLLHDQNGLLPVPAVAPARDGGSAAAPSDPAPDLVLVVLNNDGGGIFSFLPQAQLPGAFEPLFGTPHGVDLRRLAAGLGVGHTLLERADDLSQVLAAARAGGGVQLVEVRTERAANRVLHERLAAVAAAALP